MRDTDSPLDAELNALERQLAALSPAARLDRDAVMFAAGVGAGRRRARRAAALFGTAGATCGAVLALLVAGGQPPGGMAPPDDVRARLVRVQDDRADEQSPAEVREPAGTLAEVADGPTNYRLLREWSSNRDAGTDYQKEPSAPDEPLREPARPELPRELLKRYLDATAQL